MTVLLDGSLWTPPSSFLGFDCDSPLSTQQAVGLKNAGYHFAVRYLKRITAKPTDLTLAEGTVILGAGLGLMAVQHVEDDKSWHPDGQKGYNYGQGAVEHARRCGLPPGTMVWLDLEAVQEGTPHSQTIDYCNTWHSQIASAGYLPGLYIGWHCGLTPAELYRNLRFTHYWAAYNLNADEVPIMRGVQMKQALEEIVAGVTIDPDSINRDRLGSAPSILMPI